MKSAVTIFKIVTRMIVLDVIYNTIYVGMSASTG